jgi:hypothetical protein
VRRGELPLVRAFVRSLVRSSDRLSLWSKENDNGGKKVMTKGRRSKIKDWQRKSFYMNAGGGV